MVKRLPQAAVLLGALAACAAERASWPTPSYRGRQVWPLFGKQNHILPEGGGAYEEPPSARGLSGLSMVKGYACALTPEHRLGLAEYRRGYIANKPEGWDVVKDPASGKPVYAVRIPEERRHKGVYTLRELAGPAYGDFLYDDSWTDGKLWNPQKDAPVLLGFPESRPVYFLPEKLHPDREDFLRWKAAHPNFVGFYAMGEIDSDTGNYVACVTAKPGNRWVQPEPEVRAAMASRFPPPTNSREWFENLKRVWAKEVEFHFGENMFWPLYCNNCSLAHMNAALGAVGLINETSSSCGASFAFSGIYTRGASRQWGIPFAWYCANFYRGFFRDGRENKTSTWCNKWPRDGVFSPSRPAYMGSSISLMHRQQTYGWLIGAAMIEDEGFPMHSVSATNGVPCPSPYADAMERLFVRAGRIDRGASWTPVAFLVPLTESFHRMAHVLDRECGCPENLPAWFLTLVPYNETSDPEGGLHTRRKHGDEGCLFNSPYGDIVDVLVPDAGQDSARFADVLGHYSVAILMGSYRRGELDVAALEAFVRGGGELVISADYVEEGLVPESLSGVGFDGRIASGRDLRDASGKTVEALNGAYSLYRAVRVDAAAAPVLSDENGTPVAFSRGLGEGRVITVAAKRCLPLCHLKPAEPAPADGGKKKKNRAKAAPSGPSIRAGTGELGIVRRILGDAQDRFVPVRVDGDVAWGLSKTGKGWFLWLMNNKGVVKYAGEPAEFDMSKAASVKVDLRSLSGLAPRDAESGEPIPVKDGCFAVKVDPGAMRFVAVEPPAVALR